MNIAEILRKLADVVDGAESNQASAEITNRPDQASIEVDQPTDTAGIEKQAQVNVATMVPPLQQKLDLMKKLAGEDACAECGCTPCACEQGQDELAIMRQNAGIAPAVIAIADEDEPFEG
jgi:hypothetical protein